MEFDCYWLNEFDGKIVWFGEGDLRVVDSNGSLFGGEIFLSFLEFKWLLVCYYLDYLVCGFVKWVVFFGMGYCLDIEDLVVIEKIIDRYFEKDYLVREIFKVLICEVILE